MGRWEGPSPGNTEPRETLISGEILSLGTLAWGHPVLKGPPPELGEALPGKSGGVPKLIPHRRPFPVSGISQALVQMPVLPDAAGKMLQHSRV